MESLQKKPIAFFDVDGTLVSTTIVHAYIWLQTSSLPRIIRFFWFIGFLPKVVFYLILDRISRPQFNRVFYRNYRGKDATALKALAVDMFASYLRQKIFPEAISQIEEHKAQGDQVVLLTGSLNFIVQPIAEFLGADSVIAPELKEQDGIFTGRLTTEPLIGEQKAIAMKKFAEQEDIPLDICYAYSDSKSDLEMLESVGNPIAVNPSKGLRDHALESGWEIHEWMKAS